MLLHMPWCVVLLRIMFESYSGLAIAGTDGWPLKLLLLRERKVWPAENTQSHVPTLLGFWCISKLSTVWPKGWTYSYGIDFRNHCQLMNNMKATEELCVSGVFYCWHFIQPSLLSSNTTGNGLISDIAVRWNSLSNWWNFNLHCSCPFQMATF